VDFPFASPPIVQYNNIRYDLPGDVSRGIGLYEKTTETGRLRHGEAGSATSNPVTILSRCQVILIIINIKLCHRRL
jgi:hypothetical protein